MAGSYGFSAHRIVYTGSPISEKTCSRHRRACSVCSNRAATRVNDLKAREKCHVGNTRFAEVCKAQKPAAGYRAAFARRRSGVRIPSAPLPLKTVTQ
jgi:hypothetical protein